MRVLALLIAAAALARPAPAEACGCDIPERCEELFAGTTFVGKAISATSLELRQATVTFEVTQVLFARQPVGRTLTMKASAGTFVPGKRYVVYASGPFASMTCSNTHEVTNVDLDPDVLFARRVQHQRTGRIWGRVHIDGEGGAGVVVRIAGTDRTARTDERGAFELAMPPGTYQLVLADPRLVVEDGDFAPVTIAGGGACVQSSASAQWRGRIQGSVVDGRGQPVAGAVVSAERLDGSAARIPAVRTDAQGRYALSPLPPERFRVGVSLGDTPYEDRLAFAPTYAPGTGDASHAAPIAVGLAQTVIDVDIVVPPRRRVATIRGHVTAPGGAPAAGAIVILETAAGDALTSTISDARGRYSLAVDPTAQQYLRMCSPERCLEPLRVPAHDATHDFRTLPNNGLADLL